MYWIIAIVAGLILFVLLCLSCCCYVVSESEYIIVERVGRFHKVLNPGTHCLCPCIDTPRNFPWIYTYCDGRGNMIDETVSNYRIDTRESIFKFPSTDVYTKDTLLLSITSVMFYRITDVQKANYEVDDLLGAMVNATSTTLKEAFSQMTLNEALECQDFVNDYLIRQFSHHFDKWGVEVTRVELLEITPGGGSDRNVLEAMRMEMIAERNRRGDYIRNEGEKVAQNLIADAQKTRTRIEGISDQEATKRISEGKAASTVLLAQAEKLSLDAITHITNSDNISYTDFFLTKQFLSVLRSFNGSSIVLPFDLSLFSSTIYKSAPTVFGRFGSLANALTVAKLPEPKLSKDQVFNLPPSLTATTPEQILAQASSPNTTTTTTGSTSAFGVQPTNNNQNDDNFSDLN